MDTRGSRLARRAAGSIRSGVAIGPSRAPSVQPSPPARSPEARVQSPSSRIRSIASATAVALALGEAAEPGDDAVGVLAAPDRGPRGSTRGGRPGAPTRRSGAREATVTGIRSLLSLCT